MLALPTLVSLMLRQIPLTWFQVYLASNYWQYFFKKVRYFNYQPYFLFLFPPSAKCDLDAGIENAGPQLPDYAPKSTSSEDSYLLAKRWLQNCQKSTSVVEYLPRANYQQGSLTLALLMAPTNLSSTYQARPTRIFPTLL